MALVKKGEHLNRRGVNGYTRDRAWFRDRCHEFMEQDGGWDKIFAMTDSKGDDRRWALELIVHYAYGKPTQRIAGADDGDPLRIVIVRAEP